LFRCLSLLPGTWSVGPVPLLRRRQRPGGHCLGLRVGARQRGACAAPPGAHI